MQPRVLSDPPRGRCFVLPGASLGRYRTAWRHLVESTEDIDQLNAWLDQIADATVLVQTDLPCGS
jgi:hypothetical protein